MAQASSVRNMNKFQKLFSMQKIHYSISLWVLVNDNIIGRHSHKDLVIVECEGTTSNTEVSRMSNGVGDRKMATLDYVKSFLPSRN